MPTDIVVRCEDERVIALYSDLDVEAHVIDWDDQEASTLEAVVVPELHNRPIAVRRVPVRPLKDSHDARVLQVYRETRLSRCLTAGQHALVLAALRLYQQTVSRRVAGDEPAVMGEFRDHFEGVEPLTLDELDDFIEEFN